MTTSMSTFWINTGGHSMNRIRVFYLLILAAAQLAVPSVYAQDQDAGTYLEHSRSHIEFLVEGETADCTTLSTSALPSGVPEPYRSLFPQAAAEFNTDVTLLAAIFAGGEHGGSFPANSDGPWATSPVGASGPFQFMPGTWATYGVDGDGDGDKDIQDLTDAAYGAANYLAANGGTVGAEVGDPNGQLPPGEPNWVNAIWHYNHARWYVEQVLEFRQQMLTGGTTSIVGSGGGCGVFIEGFPLVATKKVIRGGVDGDPATSHDVWCFNNSTNHCHHDYPAADIHAPVGTIVAAAVGGEVTRASDVASCDPDRDEFDVPRVTIKGADGRYYYYTHMNPGSIKVDEGQQVAAGEVLGEVGPSECAQRSEPHLHFDISTDDRNLRYEGAANMIDPQPGLTEAFGKLPES